MSGPNRDARSNSEEPTPRVRRPRGQTRDRVFAYVSARLRAGDPPTVREIRDALTLRATQTVQTHLQALVEAGRLEQDPVLQRGRARGYRLPTAPVAPFLVPLLGRVQAGVPTFAHEEIVDYVAMTAPQRSRSPRRTVGGAGKAGDDHADDHFALRVVGESMIGAAILPGDVVIVRRGVDANDGDIIVALIGDEATVKTLRMRAGRVELHPANPAFAVLVPDADDVHLLGRVVEVRRSLGR